METTQSDAELLLITTVTPPKKRGRKPRAIDPVKLNSFMAALASADSKGRSISYLQSVTGLTRVEAQSVIRGFIKLGKIKQLGSKRGATYLLV